MVRGKKVGEEEVEEGVGEVDGERRFLADEAGDAWEIGRLLMYRRVVLQGRSGSGSACEVYRVEELSPVSSLALTLMWPGARYSVGTTAVLALIGSADSVDSVAAGSRPSARPLYSRVDPRRLELVAALVRFRFGGGARDRLHR